MPERSEWLRNLLRCSFALATNLRIHVTFTVLAIYLAFRS